MPYKAKGKCVYKADTGKKVGCTKGPVSKYLAALHANVPDAKHESKKSNTMKKSTPISGKFDPTIIKRIADQVIELQKDTLHEPVWNIDEFMFRNMVMEYVDADIMKMWLKMNDAQQEQLQQEVERYLGKTDADYRNPEYHEVNETENTTMNEATKVPNEAAIKKIVQYLAKISADHQNWIGLDAPHDIDISGLNDAVENSNNKKVLSFWKKLSRKQQNEIHNMVSTYLYNKALKAHPDYYDDQPTPVNYKLSPKTSKPDAEPAGGNEAKLVKSLAKKAADWMNYVDVDSPEQIMFDDFEEFVINDSKNKKLQAFWNSLGSKKQEALFDKVVDVLEKQYGDGDDDMYEGRNLSEMAKKMMQEGGGFVSPETSAGWAALRRREKGDDDGPDLSRSMVGVTFFNVPAGKEEIARQIGLKQFKSGKWGHKHVTHTQTTIDVEKLKAAEKEFGKGRYWQPKN